MLKLSESEQLSKDLFVKVSGDDGFNDDVVLETMEIVMVKGRLSNVQRRVFTERLSDAGQSFAIRYCEAYVKGGMWKALMVVNNFA